MLAIAVERSNIHKRFALNTLKITGTKPSQIVLGLMLSVFFISMWMSNTTTVLIVIPICLAIIKQLSEENERYMPFKKALLLAVAYAATLGGLGTLVGTPPNIICASILSKGPSIGVTFIGWMKFALPVSLVVLTITWILLSHLLYKVDKVPLPIDKNYINNELKALGKMSSSEKRVLIVFLLVASLWLFRGLLPIPYLHEKISDTTIAIAGAIALFLIPAGGKSREALLTWDSLSKLPWGVLLLFGGGLALSEGFTNSGLTDYITQSCASLEGLSLWLILLIVITIAVLLSEIMSNTACAALLVPIMISLAQAFNVPPIVLAIPVTMAVSTAFMLPVGTPPNTIVYSYNILTMRDMVKAGLWLDIISISTLVVAAMLLLPH